MGAAPCSWLRSSLVRRPSVLTCPRRTDRRAHKKTPIVPNLLVSTVFLISLFFAPPKTYRLPQSRRVGERKSLVRGGWALGREKSPEAGLAIIWLLAPHLLPGEKKSKFEAPPDAPSVRYSRRSFSSNALDYQVSLDGGGWTDRRTAMSALDRKVSGISPAVQTCLLPTICDTLQASEKGNNQKKTGAVILRILRQVARRTGKHEKTILKIKMIIKMKMMLLMIIKMKIKKVIMKVMKITMNRMVTTGNTECICCISLFRHTAGTTKKKHTTQAIPSVFFKLEWLVKESFLPLVRPTYSQGKTKTKL